MHQAMTSLRLDSFTANERHPSSSHFERTLIRTRTIDGVEWLFSDDVAASIAMWNVDDCTARLKPDQYQEIWLLSCADGPGKVRLVTSAGADALSRRLQSARSKRFREWLTTRTSR